MMERKKALELDKICRVCICERKDMRPLFSEKVAEMLMECTSVNVEPTEGWPDKICVQCVHSISRCHAFKMLVERSDKELRDYIKSLTIRVIIDEKPDVKLSHNEQILNQQTSQQIYVQHQTNQAETATQQFSQRNQIKTSQNKSNKQQKQQNKQSSQQKKKVTNNRKNSNLAKKMMQTQQHGTQILQNQTPLPVLHPQEQQIIQQTVPIPESITLQTAQRLHPPPLISAQSQLLPMSANHTTAATATTVVPSTTTTLPQQVILPNGQIITTTQILTAGNGTPQLLQIITNPNPTLPAVSQPTSQYTPQFLQINGQTLQLIQQPNGQQVLQLVQLIPQRTNGGIGNTTTATIIDNDISMVDAEALMEQSEQHLIDDDDLDELSMEINEAASHVDNREQICETIVVEDDQMQVHQQIIGQNDGHDLEYLEDITVTTTSQQQQRQHILIQDQHNSHLVSGNTVIHEVGEEEDDDIIEEIHLEEDLLEDEDGNHVLLDAENSEFITEHDDIHNQLVDNNSDECRDQQIDENDENATITHYTVVDEAVDDANNATYIDALANSDSDLQHVYNDTSTLKQSNTNITHKRQKRSNNNIKIMSNSRQLTATATSIAAAGDDDIEIDAKLIADFIKQQTTIVGSGRYMCNLCRQEFRQFKGLQNHMHSHTNWIRANCKKLPQCEICFKSFKGPGMLKMHMKSHQSAAKVPTCQICGKSFKTKAILYRHRQTHQQRWFFCAVEQCCKGFSSTLSLKAHVERKHPDINNIPKYKCGECLNVFYTFNELNNHSRMTGHGSDSVTITTCNNSIVNQTFSDNNTNVHLTTTTNMNPATTTSITNNALAEVVNSNGEVFIVTPA